MTTPETTQSPGPGYDVVTVQGQLIGELTRFHGRVDLYLPESYELPDELPTQVAAQYLAALTLGDRRKRAAAELLLMLFGGGLYAPSKFWRTDLGQLVYEAGGWPGAYLSVSEASEVLRVSRGRIHQLLTDGKMERSTVVPGAPVSATVLRARWDMMRAVTV